MGGGRRSRMLWWWCILVFLGGCAEGLMMQPPPSSMRPTMRSGRPCPPPLNAVEGEGPGDRSGSRKGSTKFREKLKPESELAPDLLEEDESWYRLFLHNDEIHTFEYVTQLLTQTVPNLSKARAHELTCTVHSEGIAIVTQNSKKVCENYCHYLQTGGLTASIAPSSGEDADSLDENN